MSDDNFKSFLNPSLMNEISRIQKQNELLTNLGLKSTTISAMYQKMEKLRQSSIIQEPKWLTTAKSLAEQSNSIIKAIEQPAWLKTINQFEELTRLTSFALESSNAYGNLMKSIGLPNSSFDSARWKSEFEQPEWVKSINRFDEINRLSVETFLQNESYSQLIESAKKASQLYNLDAFESIANLRNSPLSHFNELVEKAFNLPEYSSDIHGLDEDINNEISQVDDFEKLPSTVQNKIIYYLKFIFLTILLNLISNYIYDQRELLAKTLKLMETPSEVKKFVRSGSAQFEREVLSGLRVVSGNNVNLRTEPSMKSEIIMTLNTGRLIDVVNKSNRVWLKVEVFDGEDVIQGWIARRYTVHFN
tara:strand:- start:6745 stop:7827 length:1083 start_codon:yes stop_codon:yes gene_type:complete